MDIATSLVLFLLIIIITLTLFRQVKKVTIFEYQRGLQYRKGKFLKVLEPGAYWFYTPSTEVTSIDMRRSFVAVAGQEVLTADCVSLKVSLAAEYEITEPVAAIHKTSSYYNALYTVLQLAAREAIGQAKIDDLLANRKQFSEKLMELCAGRVEEIGLKLISVDLKDLMFPGEMKTIFAQEVQARKEGVAALEKARGETAALRSLANAAKLVERSPGLMQLRLIQSLGQSSGNTLVFAMPASDIIGQVGKSPGGPASPGGDPSHN